MFSAKKMVSLIFLIFFVCLSFTHKIQAADEPILNQANDFLGNPIDKPVLTTDELMDLAKKPVNKVHIPGLEYGEITQVTEGEQTYLYIPFIGEYISTVYKYLVIFSGIIAVIIIIVSGIQWTASGGNSSTIESAKTRITGALTGLGLAVGSYIILYAINPNLVNFRSLKIQYIKEDPIENLSFLSESDYANITGQSFLPPQEILNKAIEVTKTVGLEDPCFMITIIGKESGGNPGAIGHDENYPRAACVGSRKKFLLSGVTSQGITFTPPVKTESEYVCETHNPTKGPDGGLLKNDDKFDIHSPPSYGLDWRFSHGFGLGQVTLKDTPNYWCNGQRGINMYGKCFNIPELLTVDSAAFFAANLFKSNLDCATNKGYSGDRKIQAAFWAYAAGCKNVEIDHGQDISQKGGVPRAWAHYLTCKASPTEFSQPEPSGANTDSTSG